MCGRLILARHSEVEQAFGVLPRNSPEIVSYNVAPARDVPVIRAIDGARAIGTRRGGLIPPFLRGESPKYATFNARVETMETSPAFREPWRNHQRCVVP